MEKNLVRQQKMLLPTQKTIVKGALYILIHINRGFYDFFTKPEVTAT